MSVTADQLFQNFGGEEIPLFTTFLPLLFPRIWYFLLLAQEGRRDFCDTAKCSQWPLLYKSYEATYTLKCLFFEQMAKNWFWSVTRGEISFWRFSQKVSLLEYMLLHSSYINVAIANILHYHKSLFDHQGPRNMNFITLKTHKWAWPIWRVPTLSSVTWIFHSYLQPLWGQFYAGLQMLPPMKKLR